MRPPFYMDKLSAQDQVTVKRWYRVVGGFYTVLICAAVVTIALLPNDAVQSQMAKINAAGGAVAADRSGAAQCAARDLKAVTALEAAGEARALPSEQLAAIFFTMVKARDLCRAGRVAAAMEIYDGISFGPARSATR
jgi:hypothetical protein